MTEPKPDGSFLSIRKFFAGKNVLLTGSTGFLAKAVVEKLLHDLPGIGQIYLLIRPRPKSSGGFIDPRERLREEVLNNPAFKRLRERHGEQFEAFCESKITCVPGDLTRDRLGLEEAAYTELIHKIDAVMNSAATVVFDERLDLALTLNTLGPGRLLELAKAAGAIYVHISTCYVSGRRTGKVEEKLMEPLAAIDAQLPPGAPRPNKFDVREEIAYLHQLAETVKADCQKEFAAKGLDPKTEEARNQLHTALVKAGMDRAQSFGWNDTYTFTKFLGEQLVRLDHDEVPTVIVRPSIIESSLREPEPGWLDGLRMADPLIIGFGKGRLPDFPANPGIVMDIIPADFVVNGILAAAAHIARFPGGFDLYQIASSSKNPLLFQSLYDHVRDYFRKHPFTDKSGRPVQVPLWKFPSIPEYRRTMESRYLRPAKLASRIVNSPLPIPGARKWRPRLRSKITTIEQLLYYVDIYGPYVNLDCRFETSHAYELLQSVHPDEREAFDFDPRKIQWRSYFQDVHIPGLKRNILRMDAVPRTGAGQGHLLDEESEAARKRRASVRGVPQTIVDLALRGKERFGNKPFAEIRRATNSGGHAVTRLTFEELYDRAGQWAKLLVARLGLHSGDRIALIGENGPEWPLAYLAISRAGCTAVPLDRLMPAQEAAGLIKLVEAKAIIISPALLKNGGEVFQPGAGLPPCLDLWGELNPHPGHAWPQSGSPEEVTLKPPTPETLASILFTSGTTLDPKGVMLTHSNLLSNALSVSEVIEAKETDRFVSVLPLHHAFEFSCGLLIPLHGGSTIHYVENLRGQEVLDTMKLAKATVMLGVPRLFKLFMDGINTKLAAAGAKGRVMLEVGDRIAAALEMAGKTGVRKKIFKKVHEAFGGELRVFVSGGAALDPVIFNFFQRFGIPVVEGYGLTETSPVLTVNPLTAPKAGSVGPPIPGVEIEVRQMNGEEIGEVLARGPSIMRGYWQNPSATERVFEDGWFRTGDLGRIDPEGYLHLTGRIKDVIVTSAGKNVYPDDVEMGLRSVPRVKEFCVVGLPDRSGLGEEVAAVIVPESDDAREEIKAAIAQVNRTVSSHQRVARIEFQSGELPKTSTLKIKRNRVRELFTTSGKQGKRPAPSPAPSFQNETVSDQSNVETEVACAIGKVTGISASEITPAMKLQLDLGMDSIGRVDLLQHLESQLGVPLPAEAEDKLFTVRDVITTVEGAVNAATASTRKRRSGRLWEQASAPPDQLETALRGTAFRACCRGGFDLASGAIMSSYLRVSASGLEHIPRSGPFILAANHCSHLDSAAIRKVLGKRSATLHVMAAKDYFFDTRLKSWFFGTCLNALPFDREAHATESLAVCKAVLERGRAVLIYPEGTRSTTGDLQSFKSGIGVLAIEVDAPVIPVCIRGTFDCWPKGKMFPGPGPVEVSFGAPADFSALKAERNQTPVTDLYRRAAGELRARVAALAGQLPPRKDLEKA
jgi:long-chain acyl-CoA synthetase